MSIVACSVLPLSVVPVTNAGVPAGKDGQQSRRIGHRIDEPMVGRSAPHPAEVGILIGRIRSLVVKDMTIGIEAPLTTTPENGHRLAVLTGLITHPQSNTSWWAALLRGNA